MHGLAVKLSISNWTTSKTIDKMKYKYLVQIQNVFWPNMLHSQLHGLKLNYNPFLPSDKLNLNAFVMEIKMTFWTCRCLLTWPLYY